MEMERKMMGLQIPAFGSWNYCNVDLPITQYFDLAMQSRLRKRRDRRLCHREEMPPVAAGGGGQRFVWFNTSQYCPRKPAQIKVIRREVEKQCQCDGGELQDGGRRGRVADGGEDYAMKRKVATARAVDEDLYKVPQALMYQKPRKMRKVVWSLWIGCLGLDCIA